MLAKPRHSITYQSRRGGCSSPTAHAHGEMALPPANPGGLWAALADQVDLPQEYAAVVSEHFWELI